jgi:Transglycosylase SLT domain
MTRAIRMCRIPGPIGATFLPNTDESTEEEDNAPEQQIAFGKKVSKEFKRKVIKIASDIGVDPNDLMAAMAFESGESFSASVPNSAGSGAVGLIQFMPATARALGTTSEKLAAMSAEDQLDLVRIYFMPHRGRLRDLDDLYMAILFPAAVGKPASYVLFERDDKMRSKRYEQNKGLDVDNDGKVTKAEAAAAVRAKLKRGMSPEFYG